MARSPATVRALFDRVADACRLPAAFKQHSTLKVIADHDNPFQVTVTYNPRSAVEAVDVRMPPMVTATTRAAVAKALKDSIEPRARTTFLPLDRDPVLLDTLVCFGTWSQGRTAFVIAHELGHLMNGDFFAHPEPESALDKLASFLPFGKKSGDDDRRLSPESRMLHKQEFAADAFALTLPLVLLPAERAAAAAAVPGLSDAEAAAAASARGAGQGSELAVALGGIEHLLKMELMHDTVSSRLRGVGLAGMAEASEAERRRTHPPDARRLQRMFDDCEQRFGLGKEQAVTMARAQAAAAVPGVKDCLGPVVDRVLSETK